MKPIRVGQTGAAVEDIQKRLTKLGYDLGPRGIDGSYMEHTAQAVRQFRADWGLPDSDFVDDECWSTLVDATFSLGDRSLFLRLPYFHGADVSKLQHALNALGFSCGGVDGIFGAHTERALREFQANVGIDPDGIAGSLSFAAINRLAHVWEDKDDVPQSEVHIGYSRAAAALEKIEACFYGIDEVPRSIATRVSNLALATTPDSLVTSADSIQTMPSSTMLLVEITVEEGSAPRRVPQVTFTDEPVLSSHILTAVNSATSTPPRIIVYVPQSMFVDPERPTEREQQHIAVVLLDAFCTAFA